MQTTARFTFYRVPVKLTIFPNSHLSPLARECSLRASGLMLNCSRPGADRGLCVAQIALYTSLHFLQASEYFHKLALVVLHPSNQMTQTSSSLLSRLGTRSFSRSPLLVSLGVQRNEIKISYLFRGKGSSCGRGKGSLDSNPHQSCPMGSVVIGRKLWLKVKMNDLIYSP